MGELKGAIESDEDFEDITDIKRWKLFWLGVLLEEPGVLLEDFLIDEEALKINLVEPKEAARVGDGKGRTFTSDKTRFLVVGIKKSFEVLALKPQKIDTATQFHKLPQKYFFSGKQKFGIITNITTNNSHIRQIECQMFEVNEEGEIMMQTDDDNDEAKVFLVKDIGEKPELGSSCNPNDKSLWKTI